MPSFTVSVAPVQTLGQAKYGSIKAFADAAGLAYATAYRWWHDDVQLIDVETLAKVAEALDVEPGELIKKAPLTP